MDKSTFLAIVVGGVAFAAGVFRVVERFTHIAWYGDEQKRAETKIQSQATPSAHV